MKLQKTERIANKPQVFSLSSKNPLIFVGATTELNREEFLASKKVDGFLSSVDFLIDLIN